MTANDEAAARGADLETGADDYVVKPIPVHWHMITRKYAQLPIVHTGSTGETFLTVFDTRDTKHSIINSLFTKFDNCFEGAMRDTVSSELIRFAAHHGRVVVPAW